MKILLTGATGNLGSELVPLLAKDHELKLLVRDINKAHFPGFELLLGSVTEPDLGLRQNPGVDWVVHSAALLDLGKDRKKEVWGTNVEGTWNVLDFCVCNQVRYLLFVSTAYTQAKNMYEITKAKCERTLPLFEKHGIRYAVVKPSIILGTPQRPGSQAINQIAFTIARVHSRLEVARKTVERSLSLPPLMPGCRIRGDPESTLNLIPVDVVAGEIAKLVGKEGTYYITNPNPPLMQKVADEVGKAISLNVAIVRKFKPSIIERTLNRMLSPFLPYMQGEPKFPSVVDSGFKLTEGYIEKVVQSFLKI